MAFSWEAPENDQRGKELKQIDGYWVYRKTIIKDSDVVDPDVEYEKIGQVSDTHIVVRDDLRKKAEAEGKIVRKVKVDPSLTKFSFNDSALTPGGNYLYKIVPINQDDEAGGIKKYVRVRFQGDASVVTIFDAKDIAEEDFSE